MFLKISQYSRENTCIRVSFQSRCKPKAWNFTISGIRIGPILFNIYFIDLFFQLNHIDICNFASDTTAYVCDINLEVILKKFRENSKLALFWFKENYMKLNTDKRHLIVSGTKYEHLWVKMGKDNIIDSNNVKLLDVDIDYD